MRNKRTKAPVLVMRKVDGGHQGELGAEIGDGISVNVDYTRRQDPNFGTVEVCLRSCLFEGRPPVKDESRLLTGIDFRKTFATVSAADENVVGFLRNRVGLDLQIVTVIHGLKKETEDVL